MRRFVDVVYVQPREQLEISWYCSIQTGILHAEAARQSERRPPAWHRPPVQSAGRRTRVERPPEISQCLERCLECVDKSPRKVISSTVRR